MFIFGFRALSSEAYARDIFPSFPQIEVEVSRLVIGYSMNGYEYEWQISVLNFSGPVGIVKSNIIPSLRLEKWGDHVNLFLLSWNENTIEGKELKFIDY